MQSYVFENARLLDGSTADGVPDRFVRVAGDKITEISDKPIGDNAARHIDLRGQTLMPGLIDCHVHIVAAVHDPAENSRLPNTLVALHAAKTLKGMLMRGFTTVRDMGGAQVEFVHALDQGLIEGPRLVICGKAFVQTGGHSDYRTRYETVGGERQVEQLGAAGRIVDGVDEVRRAARDEIRKGAQFIKVMANGGAGSTRFPRPYLGFSLDELKAFQDEADKAKTYVAAHLYTDEAINRALEAGFRSIEHATFIEPATAARMKRQGAIVCPTISALETQIIEQESLGLDDALIDRLKVVRNKSPESLEIMRNAGVTFAYGTDLLGPTHRYQALEFLLRAEAIPSIEVIRSATLGAAELLRMEGRIGCIAPGAYADLIVMNTDPVKDLSSFGDPAAMPMIMKGGVLYRDRLAA